MSVSLISYESLTDGPPDGQTDRRTDGRTLLDRDARTQNLFFSRASEAHEQTPVLVCIPATEDGQRQRRIFLAARL